MIEKNNLNVFNYLTAVFISAILILSFLILKDKFEGRKNNLSENVKADVRIDTKVIPLPGFIPNQQDDSRILFFHVPYGMVEDEAMARSMGIYKFYKSADGKKVHPESVISISFSKKKGSVLDLRSFILRNTQNLKKLFPGQELTVGLSHLHKDVVKKFEDMAIPYQAILFFINARGNQSGHSCAIFFVETPAGFWSLNWTAPRKILERDGTERNIFLSFIKFMAIGIMQPDRNLEIHM